jgi:dihydropteroate synthase
VGSLKEFVDDVREARGAVVMAVINTTPDSFSDGGRYLGFDQARTRIDEVLAQGADIIDIGAESTRPGSAPVSASEQLERAAPAVEYAVAQSAWVSIDTTSPEVAKEALRLGARIVNDVSCLMDEHLARVTTDAGADLILMHSRGSMSEMRGFSEYDGLAYQDVVTDVRSEWQAAAARAVACGLSADRIWFDPGLGFHKSAAHSLELMQRLGELSDLGAGLLLGASRKSFLGSLDGSPPEARLGASIAACLHGVDLGARIFRVHDVRETVQALGAKRAFSRPSRGGEAADLDRAVDRQSAAGGSAEVTARA